MAPWTFKQYLSDGQVCPILDWFGKLPSEVQAEFDLLIKNLANTEDWDEAKPNKRKYKELKREHEGLCELFLNVGERSFRPLGILHRDIREFVFLGGCEKTGQGLTDPEGAFDSALEFKRQYDEGRGVTRDNPY
jgi:hypothetical protein